MHYLTDLPTRRDSTIAIIQPVITSKPVDAKAEILNGREWAAMVQGDALQLKFTHVGNLRVAWDKYGRKIRPQFFVACGSELGLRTPPNKSHERCLGCTGSDCHLGSGGSSCCSGQWYSKPLDRERLRWTVLYLMLKQAFPKEPMLNFIDLSQTSRKLGADSHEVVRVNELRRLGVVAVAAGYLQFGSSEFFDLGFVAAKGMNTQDTPARYQGWRQSLRWLRSNWLHETFSGTERALRSNIDSIEPPELTGDWELLQAAQRELGFHLVGPKSAKGSRLTE